MKDQKNNQQKQKQKKLPIEIVMIQKKVPTIGYSFMFPKGSEAFIQRKIINPNENTIVYQGTFFNKGHLTSTEVSFDGVTGKHLNYESPSYDTNGKKVPIQSAYSIKLDISAI